MQGAKSMQMIFDTREHLEIVWRISEQIEAKSDGYNETISAMLFVSINHCDALQLLCEKKNFASAFALIRPTIENTMRAVWLRNIATEAQSNRALYKDKWPAVWELIELVEKKTGQTKLFSKLWSDIKHFSHDFTHGGIQLANRQIAPNGIITPNVPDDEVRLLLRLSAVVSVYALGELIELANEERAIPLYEKLVNQTTERMFGQAC
ncbi:DUF6988 family protein [Vibrio coralliilyticus]|uniref:DUF6988 family protein n=1 Tax=Vibrio coralliilyticus TaxID=190893 RepID=UPI001560085B|nr:hypothetical protein [Vibrio coralliilyticus]NRF17429.1 hypothetical protein [Vibrio coralliilyticus]